MKENQTGSESSRRIIHLGAGPMVIYRPILSIGRVDIVSLPSKPGHKIQFLGIFVPGTENLSGSIRRLKHRITGVDKSNSDSE